MHPLLAIYRQIIQAAALLLACGYFAILAANCVGAENDALLAAVSSISTEDAKRHVDILADDTFEGREAGSRGGRAAGMYVRKEIEKHGLKPLAQLGDYFQPFHGQYRNILAHLEGSDPLLKKETVIVGAHYDHVGYGSSTNSYGPIGYIHNGADDNASGTAGLLELIEAFAKLDRAPRRSIVFAFWDGEEKGLLGSKYFLAHPPLRLSSTKLFINLDMIGRLRSNRLTVYGSRTAPGMRGLISRANDTTRMFLHFTWEMRENSDHYPFYTRGIPILMLHTGLHDDYHRPRDDAHKVNPAGIQQVTRLLFGIVHEMAQRDASPRFRGRSRSESPLTHAGLRQRPKKLPSRLGVAWRPDEPSDDGLTLTRVTPDSPAQKAGLRVGDRVIEFDGRKISGGRELLSAVVAAESTVDVVVNRDGEEEPLTLEIELAGRPYRLGISWRTDDAEPSCVIVNRVVAGSSAALAGLKRFDRIHEFAGQPVGSTDEFRQLATTATAPLELLVERQGQMSRITIEHLPEADLPEMKVAEGSQ